eukprot:13219740-Alexandrium_andersonii.AAC.1
MTRVRPSQHRTDFLANGCLRQPSARGRTATSRRSGLTAKVLTSARRPQRVGWLGHTARLHANDPQHKIFGTPWRY